MLLVLLARHGDLVNCIPLAYSLSRKIGRVNWLVGKDYAGTLEGSSYINPISWHGGQDTLPQAIQAHRGAHPIVAQYWLNPDQRRLTDSYAKEQWRLAGMLEHFHEFPLIFDRQNEARANMLRDRVLAKRNHGRPLILVCVDAISSPFRSGPKLLAMIRGLDADVIDLRDVKAERVYDLLPLFNAADCLVTIDTLPLHLARAAMCPVIALTCDLWNGWRASIPPPQIVASFSYSEAEKNLTKVVNKVNSVVFTGGNRRSAIICADLFDRKSERAIKAQATWPDAVSRAIKFRSSKKIGDNRALPFMHDVLCPGLETCADVLVWTNDDVAFLPGAIDKIKAHAARWDFGCVRRDSTHIGRECFWFKRTWLQANIESMPDVILAAPMCDLVIAKWLRSLRGIKTTMENLAFDFPPVELPPNLVYHAPHESSWLPYQDSPSARHNKALFIASKPLALSSQL